MDLDSLSKDERNDALAQVADLFFNQQLTQVEIARRLDTTRFKIAKLIQEARDERIVEIKINYTNERNRAVEDRLCEAFGLADALVVDTKYATFIDGLAEMGRVGAMRLSNLLSAQDGLTLGLAWGKSSQAVIDQLPPTTSTSVSTVQLVGNFESSRPMTEAHELTRKAAAARMGTAFFLNAPLYVMSDETRAGLLDEPDIRRTMEQAEKLDIVLTGVGAEASLPYRRASLAAYITEEDRALERVSPGSILGYVLAEDGSIADIPLNRRLMGVPRDDIMRAPHRIGVLAGLNKAQVGALVMRKGYINEIVTTAETATRMLELA